MSDKEKKNNSAANEVKTELTSIESEGGGVIQIANDVISDIAALAVMEVDGVARLTGNITRELITKLGRKSLSKGIRLNFTENELTVDVSLEVRFGYNIVEVSKNVQERVKSNVSTMTGLNVSNVNVRISGIEMENRD